MRIKDIQIDGFGVWTGLSVDSLPDGMTVFYGPNEAGKTTVMQFIRAMLYGFTTSRREKYLPPIYGGTPGGALRVTGPGGGYEIRRHSQLTDTETTGRLSVTGQDGLTQGQHRLGSLLGQIDEPIFTNVFAIGMRELQELSTLDDTAAADELYKLSSGLDRVSLVDVLRSLRGGRKSLVGTPRFTNDTEIEQLTSLLNRREKLRDEVTELTRNGRRWNELASQRRSGQQEIDQLTERMSQWDREAKCTEVAINVFDTWQERRGLAELITEKTAEVHLPEEAPGQLVHIDASLQEHQGKIEEVKEKRRQIRVKASQLPVSHRMLELKGRIEAASEQATWIEALEEQMDRLDVQIEKATKKLEADAQRLGLDEEDQLALIEGESSQLPDLSQQSISVLSTPAKHVKEQNFLLKQARGQAAEYKVRVEKLGGRLRETLDHARADDLQEAIREQNELHNTLKHRLQVGEHLEKLKRHYRELEKEAVELTTDEALPVERLFLLAVPFIAGGLFLLFGFAHLVGLDALVSSPDPTDGMLYLILGASLAALFHFGRENGKRNTLSDRDECERQIDSLRKQIREIESERSDIDHTLPTSSESIELRLRETSELLVELEEVLPVYHNHQAATEAYKSARKRAEEASQGLREAKGEWVRTLQRLGLSESMSPTSVRRLSSDYELVQSSRRRLDELLTEKEQRKRERQTIAKRIELLYLESLDVQEDESEEAGDDAEKFAKESTKLSALTKVNSPKSPLEQLSHLHEELSRQHHWIKRRRDLKKQDLQLKRQQAAHHRTVERCEQQRRGLWAKCGVATPDQFYQMVDTKALLVEQGNQHGTLDKQIRSMIGSNTSYEEVEREIDEANAVDLDRRWDLLTTRMSETETRVGELRTSMGQLAQEMKHLGEDNRLSIAQLDLGCTERKIESVARRWQTLGMASSLLEDVCNTFERERQPETLREASSFLSQLTDGKYTRIWTPLGTNQLKIDNADGKPIPLEVLSRGTREAVFIALRLSLAAAYARRGVMLPLVLDDVLVNFDRDRAIHAARTLQTFAQLGHQVMMFTCHEHIVDIFHDIEVEVRLLPAQGEPGRATILLPEEEYEEEYIEEDEEEDVEEEVLVETEEPESEPEPMVVALPESDPVVMEVPQEEPVKPKRKPRPVVNYVEPEPIELPPEKIFHEREPDPEPMIGWAWFEREPGRRLEAAEEALAAVNSDLWIGDNTESNDELFERDRQLDNPSAWWSG